MVFAIIGFLVRAVTTLREAIHDGADLQRTMSHRYPGLMGSE